MTLMYLPVRISKLLSGMRVQKRKTSLILSNNPPEQVAMTHAAQVRESVSTLYTGPDIYGDLSIPFRDNIMSFCGIYFDR